MRRTMLIIASVLLAVPALAHAKAGVEFEQYPETTKPGERIDFTVFAFREPRGPDAGDPKPIVGAHPLVTFRSKSGKVIRVRSGRTNSEGIGHGSVAFTDRGPWTTQLDLPGVHQGEEFSQPIYVGTGLTQTIPPTVVSRPPAHPAPSGPDDGFPWVWVLSGVSILAALLVFGMRRLGRWGTA